MPLSTGDRLQQYAVFSDATIAAVSEAADRQYDQSFNELAAHYGLGAVPSYHLGAMGMPLEYWHLKPNHDYDTRQADVYFAPMAIPADASMAMRAIRLFAAGGDRQLIVIGNPGPIGRATNMVAMEHLPAVWRGDLAPATFTAVDLLNSKGVSQINLLGYSYGAEAATAAASRASEYDIAADKAVLAEPVSATKRSLASLAIAFAKSGAPLDDYVAAVNSPALEAAREAADSGRVSYAVGLLRASNLAIAKAMSRGNFAAHVEDAMIDQPTLRTTVAHGTHSELANFEDLSRAVGILKDIFPMRLKRLAIPLMHHAGGDDIDLHAAIMLQGLAD